MHAPAPSRRGQRIMAGLAMLMTATLVLAACGGDSGADGQVATADLPTGLQPQPLAEPTTLTVSIGTKAEVYAAFFLADELGEFAKENITINLVKLPSADALPALAQGKTDVAASGLGATFLNGVASDSDLRMVFPGATRNPADGLYVSIDPATGSARPVTRIATISGPGGMYVVPIARYLETVGQGVSDVTYEKIELADMQTALESGAVDAAWVNAPVTTSLNGDDAYQRVVEYDDGEYGVAYILGPNLINDRPEVGQAFVRALARTARDHLSGDYKQDPETVAALARGIESTPEEVTQTPAMTFTTDLPTEAIQKAQALWIEIGDLLQYDEVLAPETYVDASFLDRAVGAS